jgi:putative FmdB family regulatory protein
MPLYEYVCENCGNHVERLQSVHDEPMSQCPNCLSNKVRKVIHAAGIIFKGSGWYVNDSRKSSSSDAKSSSESKTSTDPKTETKKESPDSKNTAPPADTKSADTKKQTSDNK